MDTKTLYTAPDSRSGDPNLLNMNIKLLPKLTFHVYCDGACLKTNYHVLSGPAGIFGHLHLHRVLAVVCGCDVTNQDGCVAEPLHSAREGWLHGKLSVDQHGDNQLRATLQFEESFWLTQRESFKVRRLSKMAKIPFIELIAILTLRKIVFSDIRKT